MEYANPDAAFLFMAGDAKATLEASVESLIRQVDAGFKVTPAQTTKLPPLGGVTAVFISVEKKEGFFPNSDSTAVSFLLA